MEAQGRAETFSVRGRRGVTRKGSGCSSGWWDGIDGVTAECERLPEIIGRLEACTKRSYVTLDATSVGFLSAGVLDQPPARPTLGRTKVGRINWTRHARAVCFPSSSHCQLIPEGSPTPKSLASSRSRPQ